MGVELVVSAIVAAGSAMKQHSAQKQAARAQKDSAEEQRKARAEQSAGQAGQAAAERRAQIREERIRRAKIIQSSENTGVGDSSGEFGATGNLATTLGSNIGANVGAVQRAANITGYNQNAADFLSSAQSHMNDANMWGQVGSVATSVFSTTGGFKGLMGAGKSPGLGGTYEPTSDTIF